MKNLLDELRDAGAIASDALIEKTVDLPGGKAVTVFVREIPEREVSEIFAKNDGMQSCRLIAAGLRNADGSPVLNVNQIGSLKPKFARALERVVGDVNFAKPSDDHEKNFESEATSGSGASSLSDSDAPSES